MIHDIPPCALIKPLILQLYVRHHQSAVREAANSLPGVGADPGMVEAGASPLQRGHGVAQHHAVDPPLLSQVVHPMDVLLVPQGKVRGREVHYRKMVKY